MPGFIRPLVASARQAARIAGEVAPLPLALIPAQSSPGSPGGLDPRRKYPWDTSSLCTCRGRAVPRFTAQSGG